MSNNRILNFAVIQEEIFQDTVIAIFEINEFTQTRRPTTHAVFDERSKPHLSRSV